MGNDQEVWLRAKQESTMRSARLEHAILQTIMNYTAGEKLSNEEVQMALLQSSVSWQHKIIRERIRKGEMDCE